MTEPLGDVRPGMTGRKEVVVTRDLTVGAHVDGMPFVYGTPMMILAMEIASGEAVRGHLPAGWATVGSEIKIRYLAPTPMAVRRHGPGHRSRRPQRAVRDRSA